MPKTRITAEIETQIPTLAAIYATAYRSAYAAVESYGRRKASSNQFMYGQYVMANRVTRVVHCMPGTEYLCEETVLRVSQKDAEALAANYAFKVERKAEGMDITEITRMDATGRFEILGTKAGHAVRIIQSVVHKTSSKGTWFVQFPALVYIDGRKSTEKALLAL